jgi:hypothetical protein
MFEIQNMKIIFIIFILRITFPIESTSQNNRLGYIATNMFDDIREFEVKRSTFFQKSI